ncbi:MAG: PilZ domain-containing protein [Candidatus Zixiibacteriota bacterium]
MAPESGELLDIKQAAIDTACIDLTLLAGQEVTLFSEQFPGKPLTSRVALANERELTIDRGVGAGQIDNLVANQRIILRVNYKGEHLNIPAILKRIDGGRLCVVLGKKLVPLTRRNFTRIAYASPVTLAVMSATTFRRNCLNRLRWMETETVNLSGGGVLISFSGCLMHPTYLFVHLDMAEFSFPALLVTQVVYSLPKEDGSFSVGLEFIVREDQLQHFPPATISEFPATVHEYGEQRRQEVNREIELWKQKNNQQ